MKDDHGGDFIDLSAALAPVQAHLFEMLLRFKTGKPLVPENDRQVHCLFQIVGKLRNLSALRAFLASHMKGLPDNNLMNLVFDGEASQRFDVGGHIPSSESRTGLSRNQQGVADRDSDVPVTYVQSHNPHIFMIPARADAGL